MASSTVNLNLKELASFQANGEVSYNESMWTLDINAQSIVVSRQATPPGSPVEGTAYIVAPGATGEWTTHVNDIAHYYNGAYTYYTPNDGWRYYNIADKLIWKFEAGSWSVYIAGDIPPNSSFQAGVDYPPEGTPLAVAVTASVWTKIPFPAFGSVGTDLSYNGTTYELTYSGANAVFKTNVSIILTGTFANDQDYAVRVRNTTQVTTCCQDAASTTNRQPNLIGMSGNLLDIFNTSDILVCEVLASHTTTLNISGGWYVDREYYL